MLPIGTQEQNILGVDETEAQRASCGEAPFFHNASHPSFNASHESLQQRKLG